MGPNADARAERTALDWFFEATHWYEEEHQGCASCHGRHCVFRTVSATRIEYYCTACDFSSCHDTQTGRYFADLGEGPRPPGALLGAEELWQAHSPPQGASGARP
jgi:hypothetical protein